MPDAPAPAPKKGNFLTTKYHGVPGWALGGGAVLALAAFLYWRKRKAAAAAAVTTAATTTSPPASATTGTTGNTTFLDAPPGPGDYDLSGLQTNPSPTGTGSTITPPAGATSNPPTVPVAAAGVTPIGVPGYIQGLYEQYLGRDPAPSEIAAWQADQFGPTDIWHGVAESAEARQKRGNKALTWGNPPHTVTGV